MRFESVKENELRLVAKTLINEFKEQTHWVFKGQMGAGKTTLIKAICLEMGVKDGVSSPSFSLVNEYQTTGNETLYHFDFYRLEEEEEAYEYGYEEYFFSGNICFIEWPERIPNLLPNNYLLIQLETNQAARDISAIIV